MADQVSFRLGREAREDMVLMESRGEKQVAVVDARIEETHRNGVSRRWFQACGSLLCPFGLLERLHVDECCRALLRETQLGHHVEKNPGFADLLDGAMRESYRSIRKSDDARADLQSAMGGFDPKDVEGGLGIGANAEPNLPSDGLAVGRERNADVCPERVDCLVSNLGDAFDKLLILWPLLVSVLFEILLELVLEIDQFPIRDENSGERPISFLPNVQQLDALLDGLKTLEGQLKLRLALEDEHDTGRSGLGRNLLASARASASSSWAMSPVP